ncbi:MAG: hypothetical protein N2662_10500 [Bacteroidales bacterium]|nr:hypothetical protein [Bacteroidales bacterium]
MLQYVRHENIDKLKWDRAIEYSIAGMPYALSWYLDTISPYWDAIIDGDYKSIMPIPVKKKYGLRYVIQPPFAQQLGIFSNENLDTATINSFLRLLTRKFGYVNIQLNFSNRCALLRDNSPNYVLDLNKDYIDLKHLFSENHRRNIRKIEQENKLFEANELSNSAIELFIKTNEPLKHLVPQLLKITEAAKANHAGDWQVAVNEKHEIVGVIFWLKFKYRHIYLYSLSSEVGKNLRASFFLVNQYIRQNAGDTILLDFEGSRIRGIARFFEGFGARLEPYPVYKYKNWLHLLRSSMSPT